MRQAIVMVLVIALGTGCHSVPFPTYAVQDDLSFRASMPPPVELSQCVMRVVLDLSGSEFVFTLYAAGAESGSIQFAAVSDIGATLFQLNSTAELTSVIQDSPLLSDRFLADQFAPDIAAALFEPHPDRSFEVTTTDGIRWVHSRRGEHEILRWTSARDHVVMRGVRGRLMSTIHIEKATSMSHGGQRRPLRFVASSPSGDWQARVEVVDWQPSQSVKGLVTP